MANLFQRISLICRSKASALMDMLEDPAEVIDQTIIDAKKEYAEQLKNASEVFYNEKKVKDDLQELVDEKDKYNTIAERAVLAGNDGDATLALEHVAKVESQIKKQMDRVNLATKSADALRAKLDNFKEQIENMEGKAADIKADMANAKAAKASSKVQDHISESAFAAFDRLAERAEKERMEAEALNEYVESSTTSAEQDLEVKYSADSSADVATRLAELKAKLGVQEQ